MPDPRDLPATVEAAEHAAGAGDFAAAERLLREVASRQEADLGALHPELAHTLNNLGVACERTGKPDEAERCYRRARAIAAAVLAPDHPFVATSDHNLREFCAARGVALDAPAATAAAVEARARPAKADSVSHGSAPRTDARPTVSGWSARRIAIAAVSVAGLALLLFVASRAWFGAAGQPRSAPSATAPSTPARPEGTTGSTVAARAPSLEALAGDDRGPAARPGDVGAAQEPALTAAAERAPARAPDRPATPPAVEKTSVLPPSPLVADARLCTALSAAWRCEPAGTPVRPGGLVFYTRVKSDRDTTVHHRWYAGDRLRQAVELRIRAGGDRGFRTYSRTTVSPIIGDWRVELRTRDGALLHEERFSVR